MAKKYTPNRPQKPQSPAPAKSRSTSTEKQSTGTGTGRWGWLIYAAVVMAITAMCYWPSLKNELVNWDDDPNITENPNIEQVGKIPWGQTVHNIFDIDKGAVIGNYNPLPILTFAAEKSWNKGEIKPGTIHMTNLWLHVFTVFFAFWLLIELGMSRWAAAIGGLLFGIHPMRVESVAWATERKDVLFGLFFFAALVVYVRWIKSNKSSQQVGLYALMVLLAALSLFSKVQAVTLPLSMLAIDYLLARKWNFKLIWEKAPFWILSLIFGLINLHTLKVQGSTNDDITDFTFFDRLCIGAYSFCVYLWKLLIPHPMSPLYPYPRPLPVTVYLSPILFLAAVALFVWLVKRNQRWLAFGCAFFFVNVMFLLQVLGAGQGFLADRFTYVPYFGFFAIGAWAFDRYTERNASLRTGLLAGMGLLFAIYAYVTVQQIGIWKNGETLWTHVIKYEGKTNSLPFWNRGQFLRKLGKYEQAMSDYTQAVEINPGNPELYNSRGKTYFDMAMSGKYDARQGEYVKKAIDDYTAALDKPTIKQKSKAEVLINRGAAYAASRTFAPALQDLDMGIKLDSTNKNGYFNRSLVYYNVQMYDKAIADYEIYLKYDPYNVNVWYEKGMLERSMNKNQQAVDDLNRALKLDPRMGLAYLERARAYSQLGNKASARRDYQLATQYGLKLTEQDMAKMNEQ